MTRPCRDARHHLACAQCLDKQDNGENGKDVVEGGERGKPVHCEIACPDNENGKVDRENPDHENEDGVGVVVKAQVDSELLYNVENLFTCSMA